MASYSVAQGAHGAYGKVAAANTVDTITFGDDLDSVEVFSDGTAALYVTVDGSTPTVAGTATYELPVGARAARRIVVGTSGSTVVKVISSGAPTYSVSDATGAGLVASGPGSSAVQLVGSTTEDFTQTLVTTGAATGLPATRTWVSGPNAGKTTTYTYDATTGGLTNKVTA